MASDYVIEMLHITKEFPGIKANDDITLQLKRGEIHALLGENGAGKSTLMSVLFGLYQAEQGTIKKDGKEVQIKDPNDANRLGIGMVHQHFRLVSNYTVTENIILGMGKNNSIETINLSNLSYEGTGVAISNSTITINKQGTYYFTGTLAEGNIVVNAGDDDNVVLVFENANITCTTTAVINGVNAKNIIINVKAGSSNTFTDSTSYTVFTEDDEPNATIFSKTDLMINGKGTLIVNANYDDGIVSKDDLVITNANIQITSADDGIRGKDSVDIKNATITINAKGDGIKSTNDTDTSKGYVLIDNSKITINAESDGIQAETILNTSNSNLTITTTGDTSSEDVSSKGLKAGKEITINSGNISISSTDDTIHSNYFIIINGGNLELSSKDDGIHADTDVIINGGNIDITKSYEGIEAAYIEINDGEVSIVASDDGLNASDGSGDTNFWGRQESFNTNTNVQLVINGGNIYVNASGDGLDSNGTMTQTGGDVIVAGTQNNGNGALDYDSTFNITGGSLIVYGATGMWQNPSTTSSQYSLCFSASGKAGDKIEIKDSNGNTVESFTTDKAYNAILISNSKLQKGTTYTLYVNGSESSSLELTSIVTSTISGNGMGGGMMQGGGRR